MATITLESESLCTDNIDHGFHAMLASRSGGERIMRKVLCLIFYQALILAPQGASAQRSPAIPELPPLVIDNVAPVVRNQIQEAYADASAHPNNDDAVGRLGMVLQTYGLLKEAAACYRRASKLAPSTFR